VGTAEFRGDKQVLVEKSKSSKVEGCRRFSDHVFPDILQNLAEESS
jgi:hypothetical protein